MKNKPLSKIKNAVFIITLCLLLAACNQQTKVPMAEPPKEDLIFYLMHGLNEAVIQDGFSPPVVARIYAYCNLAAFEAQNSGTPEMGKYRDVLNGYNPEFPNVELKEINQDYVTYEAFCGVAREVVYRDFIIDTLYKTTPEIYFAL